MFGRSYFGASYFPAGIFAESSPAAESPQEAPAEQQRSPTGDFMFGAFADIFQPAPARRNSTAQQNFAAIMALMHAAAAGALECR